ncbi:esterase-like activity of phytase family protein [Desertibaculum subflavum]|uniref:esterase-like activity of phytase family protein n=1 Tax=Desertibaculum subflavum TaxID=2268458 RepID=UPI000E6746F1
MRFVLLVALAALAGMPAVAERVAITSVPVPLDGDRPERQGVGRLTYLAGYELKAVHEGWGGFSDLELAADGAELRAVADQGFYLSLAIALDAEGRLLAPDRADLARLIGLDGQPLGGKRGADAEATARLDDGSLVIAFEQRHRLVRYPPGQPPTATRPVPFPAPGRLSRLPPNGGIEALAALPQSRLLALAEDPLEGETEGAAWLQDAAGWHRLTVRRSLLFRPTAAALLPGGDVLLLERRFTLIGGVAARLSRIPAGTIRPGAALVPEPLAELASPLTVDNFEGIAIGRGPRGETLVYLISDDNTNMLQRTLLLQFRLD